MYLSWLPLNPFKTYTLEDLKARGFDKPISHEKAKNKYRIACIDDNVFGEVTLLQNNGINILHLRDLSDMSHVVQFDIILCDIDKVGRYFDPVNGTGVDLMEMIRARYPAKYVIGYSGLVARKADIKALLEKARQIGDDFVVKESSIPIKTWISIINKSFDAVSNPVANWSRIRKKMVLLDTEGNTFTKLEDIYVRAILGGGGKQTGNQNARKYINGLSIAADAKEIFGDLMSGALGSLG